MSFRFLYLDSEGNEIRLESPADLRRAVEDGNLGEDMLLYDGETSEWSPARTHPLVRDALERGKADRRAGGAGRRAADTLKAGDLSGLTLTSSDSEEGGSPESDPVANEDDTVRAFRERLERERRRQSELGPGGVADGLTMVRGDRIADLHDPLASDEDRVARTPRARATGPDDARDESQTHAAAQDIAPGPAGADAPTEATERTESTEPVEPLEPFHVPAWSDARATRTSRRTRTTRRRTPPSSDRSVISRVLPSGLSPQAAVLALLIGVGGWGIADALATSADAPDEPETATMDVPPAPEPVADAAPVDLSASTYVAFADMQRGMETLGRRLGVAEPPTAWLSGRYLADAATLPQVRDFWVDYGAFVDSIRAEEETLFRSGYVNRLRSEGVTGSALSIRLSGALQDFRADRARRDEIYRTMDALAAEALTLDTWLREVSDRIAYAGVRGGAVSMAPEIEAAPLDDETRRELDTRLNRVLDALERVTGPDPSRARTITGRIVGDTSVVPPGGEAR